MLTLDALQTQMSQLRADILTLLENHAKTPTPETERLLRQLRFEVALSWTRLPAPDHERALAGVFGEIHERIMYSGLRELPLTGEEEPVVSALGGALGRGWAHPETAAAFLATTLFAPGHRAGVPLEGVENTPPWLFNAILRVLFEVPRLFLEPGESIEYLRFAERVTAWIADDVPGWTDAEMRRQATATFTQSGFLVQTYFNEESLRPLLEKRAAILERAVNVPRAALDGPARAASAATTAAAAGRKIRLGILAPHFNPQTETYFLLSHYDHLDRERFHLTLYALGERRHPLHDYCASRADAMVVLPGGDVGACVDRLRRDELDALVIGTNLAVGVGPCVQLALFRLAPVQVAIVNSPATTGMRHMTTFVSPALDEPEGAAAHYREKLLTLPGWSNVFAYHVDQTAPTRAFTRDDLGVPAGAVLFASGANYFKLLPELDHTFGRILARVPGSRLLLYPFNPNWSGSYEGAPLIRRMKANLATHGVTPDRLVIQKPVPERADIHGVLANADVYLDSFPYSGSCSLIDPLQVGCPPVVKDGAIQRSKQGAAIMRRLGLDALVTGSEDQYVELAVALGSDAARRKALRDDILAKMTPATSASATSTAPGGPAVLDTRGFSRAFGEALAAAVAERAAGGGATAGGAAA